MSRKVKQAEADVMVSIVLLTLSLIVGVIVGTVLRALS